MGFAFNPFTGNFDLTGSGGGASYIDGEVAVYADLPLDGSAALNSAWLVRTASGVWPVSRKQAGIYIRTATGGSSRDADFTYAGTMPDLFSDAQFLLYDNSDTSRNLAFDLGSIATGTTRTLTAPNSSGTISLTGHTHDGSEIYTSANDERAAFVTQSFADGNGIYYPLPDSTLNGKRVYRTTSGHYVFFENLRWHITDGSPITANIVESSDDDSAAWPWLSAWSGDVDKAKLADVVGRARDTFLFLGDSIPNTSVSGLATVAASGDYDDLSGKPAIPTASTATPSALGTAAAGTSTDFSRADHVHGMPNASSLNSTGAESGDLPVAQGDGTIAWQSGAVWAGENLNPADVGAAAASHTHGNLTNDGKLGSTSGLPLVTTTAGAVTTLALGAAGTVLTVNSGASGVEFAAPAAGGGSTNLWVPASAWIPKTTAGCGVDSRETTTNDQNFDELLFDTGSDELADALVIMPSNYNNSTVTARFYWTAASGSGGVAWAIQGRAFANDDALDTAAGTAQLVTDTLITANDMHVTSATSAATIGGTPAANTPIQFTIYRDVSDAADTLGVDARLLGVEILFN